jgi:N-methylhydantoinase A/oxoprolinase/acetone carboxylase beta subunit
MRKKDSEQRSRIGLGIDAGGTFTDAVIYDLDARRLLAKAKSLTTYYDLVEGIRGALTQLPAKLLATVEVTALSTTLATNSIVEGRGHKVGLITLAPYAWWGEQIGHAPFVDVPGSVGIQGEISRPLDEHACRHAIRTLIEEERCLAIAVAGFAADRNPSQCNRVRELIHETYDVPVVCSHEISRTEYSVDAGQTAVANAKLLPIIRELLLAMRQALADFDIRGKLMVVKGDGTIVDERVARERPVETILSGPAASVSGARLLANLESALVVDIGGTTTDCALVHDGAVAVAKNGARIGPWTLGVDAVAMSTVGLGGDSRIGFNGSRQITIGPVRCIPFAYLAHEHPSVLSALNAFDADKFRGWSDAVPLDFLVLSQHASMDLTKAESALVDLLRAEGPVSVLQARTALDAAWYTLLPTTRLEACGIIKRAALTPTDLLHVSGEFTAWSAEASRRALQIFAAILGQQEAEVLATARTAVTRRLFEEIVRRELSAEHPDLHAIPADWVMLLDKAFCDGGVGLRVKVALRQPVVAIGAPARTLAPVLAQHLQTEVVIPEHAEVANAVGAIGSEVRVREEVLIRPDGHAGYTLHTEAEVLACSLLESATEQAITICSERARQKAIAAGASIPRVTVSQRDQTGTVAYGSSIFLERRVRAIASGHTF